MDPALRSELLAMQHDDEELQASLSQAGALTGHYVPGLQALHEKNAARLHDIVSQHGWPNQILVGSDGADAAWLIVQHAIGNPELQRRALPVLQAQAQAGHIPKWHAAYLADRIAMYEGRPQRYGTQWLEDPQDGLARPWPLAEPDKVDRLRATVGLGPLDPIPERRQSLSETEQARLRENQLWWRNWLASRGW